MFIQFDRRILLIEIFWTQFGLVSFRVAAQWRYCSNRKRRCFCALRSAVLLEFDNEHARGPVSVLRGHPSTWQNHGDRGKFRRRMSYSHFKFLIFRKKHKRESLATVIVNYATWSTHVRALNLRDEYSKPFLLFSSGGFTADFVKKRHPGTILWSGR